MQRRGPSSAHPRSALGAVHPLGELIKNGSGKSDASQGTLLRKLLLLLESKLEVFGPRVTIHCLESGIRRKQARKQSGWLIKKSVSEQPLVLAMVW